MIEVTQRVITGSRIVRGEFRETAEPQPLCPEVCHKKLSYTVLEL